MTIFFGIFYNRLKGDFFFISGCGQNVISALFSELSTRFKITMYKMFMKYKVQLPKKSTCRATSDILYIYCMIAREIWRFTPPGKIIFPERNMIFLWEYIFIYLPNVRALNCSLYLTTGDNLEYIGFQSFFNSSKAQTVVNVYRFLSLSVFWF